MIFYVFFSSAQPIVFDAVDAADGTLMLISVFRQALFKAFQKSLSHVLTVWRVHY